MSTNGEFMEKEEFKLIVKGLKAVYADPKFLPDEDAWNMWLMLLGDMPYEQVSMATKLYMMTEKYPPTVADIREKAAEIVIDNTGLNELGAWALVRKAMRNSYYNAKSEFEKLPRAVQIALGGDERGVENLKEMGQMDIETVESVEKSHFVRNYRVAVLRMQEDAMIPEAMKIAIGKVRQTLDTSSIGIATENGDDI